MLIVTAPVLVAAGTKTNCCPDVYAVSTGVQVPVMVLVPAIEPTRVPEEFWTCASWAASVRAVPAPTEVNLKLPSGRFAVGVVSPFFASELVSAVAMSSNSELTTTSSATVLKTYGVPATRLYVPLPLRAICLLLF